MQHSATANATLCDSNATVMRQFATGSTVARRGIGGARGRVCWAMGDRVGREVRLRNGQMSHFSQGEGVSSPALRCACASPPAESLSHKLAPPRAFNLNENRGRSTARHLCGALFSRQASRMERLRVSTICRLIVSWLVGQTGRWRLRIAHGPIRRTITSCHRRPQRLNAAPGNDRIAARSWTRCSSLRRLLRL